MSRRDTCQVVLPIRRLPRPKVGPEGASGDVRVTYQRLREIIREELAAAVGMDTAEVPRAKFTFTDDEHREQCRAAECGQTGGRS